MSQSHESKTVLNTILISLVGLISTTGAGLSAWTLSEVVALDKNVATLNAQLVAGTERDSQMASRIADLETRTRSLEIHTVRN